eukprot:NODE_652_length_4999_cov_0.731020.p4 type:complete len:159 gc:universal NODE_652_length_4999_cov_0.731020:3351-3827(+)
MTIIIKANNAIPATMTAIYSFLQPSEATDGIPSEGISSSFISALIQSLSELNILSLPQNCVKLANCALEGEHLSNMFFTLFMYVLQVVLQRYLGLLGLLQFKLLSLTKIAQIKVLKYCLFDTSSFLQWYSPTISSILFTLTNCWIFLSKIEISFVLLL